MSQISSFTACSQRHKRIFVVGKCHEMSIYEQEGGPFLRRKQEEPIFAAMYSPWTMTICTANREDVKVATTRSNHARAGGWAPHAVLVRLVPSISVLTRLSPSRCFFVLARLCAAQVWDGLTGNLSRVYRGLAESDLTAVCLDARQRKLFVGDQQVNEQQNEEQRDHAVKESPCAACAHCHSVAVHLCCFLLFLFRAKSACTTT